MENSDQTQKTGLAGAPDAPDAPDDAPGDDQASKSGESGDDPMDTDKEDSDGDPESDSSDGLDDALAKDRALQVLFFSDLLTRLPTPALPCNPVDLVSLSGGHLGTAMRRLEAHFVDLPPWDEVSLYRRYASFIERPAVQPAPLAPILEESVRINSIT